jgi:hypothetical protein
MKAYLFRPNNMGKKSCEGVAKYSKTGIFVVQSQVDEHPSNPHLCIRWGCISTIPIKRNVLNKLEAINRTTSKGAFRLLMSEKGLAPKSWNADDMLDIKVPCVVRPEMHAKAQAFYLCKTPRELSEAIRTCGNNWYASEFIDKATEFRINVLQGRVLCVIEKSAKDASDITFSQGSTSILYWSEWNIPSVKQAIEAVKLSGLDFAGVDVILGKDGKAYVLELNTCPFLEGNYQQQCFAKGFDWVVEKGREHIPVTSSIQDWKTYIHPCMSNMARV